MQHITAATRDSAQFLGLDSLGVVASGKNADFLMLDANPLEHIANPRRIWRVYLRGTEVERANSRQLCRARGWHTVANCLQFHLLSWWFA